MTERLLTVENLQVSFATRDGRIRPSVELASILMRARP